MCYLVKLRTKNVRMRMQKHIGMVQDLVNEIDVNIADEINVMDLAQTFGLSPWHFQRLFKALVGDSLGGYLRGRGLAIAAEMLVSTSLTFIEVAFRVGFNSHEAFTRSFKSYYKMTPTRLSRRWTIYMGIGFRTLSMYEVRVVITSILKM